MSEAGTTKMVPAIRFVGFDGAWVESQLGKQLEISSASRVHKEEWTKEGVPFFRTSDVVAKFKGNENSKAFISHELFKKLSAKSGAVEKGDLLVTGGGSIGIAYLVDSNDPLYFKDADLLWLKNSDGISGYYLYTFFVSQPFRKYVNSISHIGTISHYTIEQAKVTPINVSTPEEQTKIGAYFQQLDALIAGHRGKRDKLLQLKKSLLEKMFPKHGQDKPEIRFAGFDGDWVETTLSGVAPNISDGDWIEADHIYKQGLYRIIQTGNLGLGEYIDKKENAKFFHQKDFDEIRANEIFPGDLLISRLAEPAGRTIVLPETGHRMVTAVDITIIRPHRSFNSIFLMSQMNTDQVLKQVNESVSGTSHKRISRSNLEKTKLAVPEKLDEQTKIGQLFKHTDSLITQHQKQITKLEQVKTACLAKMFV